MMKLTIGEMSKLHNVSIHTLRYYDQISLLNPSEVDEFTNYRYYDEYDCYCLARIKALKDIGLPLKKIQSLLEVSSLTDMESAFQDKYQEVSEKVKHLNEVLGFLEDQLEDIKELKHGRCIMEPIIKYFPRRNGYTMDVTDDSTLKERIDAINKFEVRNKANSEIFFKPSRMVSIADHGERKLKYYLAIQRGALKGKDENLHVLEAGNYVVLDHVGHGRELNQSYDKLFNYLRKKKMTTMNEAVEILVLNSNVTTEAREYRTQIQIKIKEDRESVDN